ncbi:hypothetical protein EGR_10557 [Echinococcus granulosus]|uniref:Uncharacterized protein n=1 Tax=Echinococcus granulosus TaxID=6210 RepID=W6U0N4_ECHGR|nr:hypothetical protein EGR_10557 [Echinococcus granulosus]EUB54588.1 hypothetical protein EGR_10557 [Echinococcus granulosus]
MYFHSFGKKVGVELIKCATNANIGKDIFIPLFYVLQDILMPIFHLKSTHPRRSIYSNIKNVPSSHFHVVELADLAPSFARCDKAWTH